MTFTARERGLLAVFFGGGVVALSAYRAAYLPTCDLVHGYLIPTRGLLFSHKDPYVDYAFNSYSPFFYALMAPLAPLPDALASVLWSLSSFACLWGVVVFTRRLLALEQPVLRVSSYVAPLLGLTVVLDNFFLGQSNLLPLFCVVASMVALTARRQLTAGALLAVAIAWKLTPALFLLHLLLLRRWKALISCACMLAVCLVLVPSLVFGPIRAGHWLKEWTELVVRPFTRGEKVRTSNIRWYHTNQSLEAVLNRHLTPYGRETYGGLHRWLDPARLDEEATRRIANLARLSLLALLAFVSLRGRSSVTALALYLMAAVFISPASWYSHYVGMVVAYAVAAERIASTGSRWLCGALGFAVVLTSISLSPTLRSYSLPFFGQAVLFAALAADLFAVAVHPIQNRVPP